MNVKNAALQNRASTRETVRIGEVVRNAVAFNFRRRERGDMNDLLQAVEELFALLEARRVACVLVGGIALLQYVEGRNTEDIDLIVAPSDLSNVPEIEIAQRDDDFARGTFQGLRIDFLLTRNALFNAVQKRYATTQRFAEREISCATVEGLLLLKLYALPALYRMGNFARVGLYENDIATLLHDYRPPLAPLYEELSQHLGADDLRAVQSIVTEIESRIARFQNARDEEI